MKEKQPVGQVIAVLHQQQGTVPEGSGAGASFMEKWQERGALPAEPPRPPWIRISLPRHDLFGEERWPISERRRARSLFLNGLLLGSVYTGIQVKLINHCQAVRMKQ